MTPGTTHRRDPTYVATAVRKAARRLAPKFGNVNRSLQAKGRPVATLIAM